MAHSSRWFMPMRGTIIPHYVSQNYYLEVYSSVHFTNRNRWWSLTSLCFLMSPKVASAKISCRTFAHWSRDAFVFNSSSKVCNALTESRSIHYEITNHIDPLRYNRICNRESCFQIPQTKINLKVYWIIPSTNAWFAPINQFIFWHLACPLEARQGPWASPRPREDALMCGPKHWWIIVQSSDRCKNCYPPRWRLSVTHLSHRLGPSLCYGPNQCRTSYGCWPKVHISIKWL